MCIVTTTITVVAVTSEIVSTTILIFWGYINETLGWGNTDIFSLHLKQTTFKKKNKTTFKNCVFCLDVRAVITLSKNIPHLKKFIIWSFVVMAFTLINVIFN